MLDERKRQILDFIIQDYVDTAVPVGSRTITRKYNVGVSPATIRNEMSDLEALGYLEQPHVSAGRVPSVKAYRLYVDDLIAGGAESFRVFSNTVAKCGGVCYNQGEKTGIEVPSWMILPPASVWTKWSGKTDSPSNRPRRNPRTS